MSSTTPSDNTNSMEQANSILCARHFHQVFWLPENDLHGRLRVTYATTSNFTDKSLPVVLICPPMFGGRWMILHCNHLAKSKEVRVICFDRPGAGGSTFVPLQDRMKVWVETVPALLKHLEVDHVSLLSHSAGTLYCLNTLHYLRDILHPEHPYVAILAPWVDNEHSKVTLMNFASKLPVTLIDSWHNVIGFVAQNIQPAVAWSGGVSSAVSGIFQNSTDSSQTDAALAKKYGTGEHVAKQLEKLSMKYFFAEDTRGGTEEAKLCLRKGGPDSWLACNDYKQYAQDLLAKEKERSSTSTASRVLKMRVFYAESDMMIGEGGKEYFEECWKLPEISEHIVFESQTIPGTDHNSVIADFEKGAWQDVFDEIKSASLS